MIQIVWYGARMLNALMVDQFSNSSLKLEQNSIYTTIAQLAKYLTISFQELSPLPNSFLWVICISFKHCLLSPSRFTRGPGDFLSVFSKNSIWKLKKSYTLQSLHHTWNLKVPILQNSIEIIEKKLGITVHLHKRYTKTFDFFDKIPKN